MPYIGQGLEQGRRQLYTFTATASQTTFSASYTPGFVDVYQNGILLAPGDYTATNGTSIVLGTGAAVSDEITIIAQHTFTLADVVSSSSGGTFTGDVTMAGNLTVQGTTITVDTNTAQTLAMGDADKIKLGDDGDLEIYHSGADSYIADAGTGALVIKTNELKIQNAAGTQGSIIIDSSGRVGIGITPAAVSDSTGADSLQLGGSFLVHFDEDGSGTTSLSNNLYWNGSNNKALFYGSTSQYYQASGEHIWRNSGVTGAGSNATLTETMRIDSSGHVGIGTTSPASELHVHSAAPGFRLTSSSDSGTPTAQFDYSPGSGYFLRLGDSANNEDVMIRSYGNSVFNGGNVGIGTSSPSVGLEVSGTGNASRLKLIDGSAQLNLGLWDGSNYRMEGDANRKILITSYHTDGVHIGNSGASNLVIKGGNVNAVGYLSSKKGTIQTVVNQPTHYVNINPVQVWAEASSSFRVSITPRFASGTKIFGTFSIPINPTGAANILMSIQPWYSTDGGTTKTVLNQGGPAGVRITGSHAWFRSSNGYDANDMQNHIVHFAHSPGATTTMTWGFYFRSEGSNTTYFCASSVNSSLWGWTAPVYMELREVEVA